MRKPVALALILLWAPCVVLRCSATAEEEAGALFKMAFRSGVPKSGPQRHEKPGMPSENVPKVLNGDVFPYANRKMTVEGKLTHPRGSGHGDGGKKPNSMKLLLAGLWDTGFGGNGGGGGNGGNGDSSDGSGSGSGFSGSLSDLEKRCKALGKATGKDAGTVKKRKKGEKSSTSKDTSVTVLVVLLLILFFVLLIADGLFKCFYHRLANREYTVLEMKPVLDAACRQMAVLAVVLVAGYMLLWSGLIREIEEDWLGYDEESEHRLLLTETFGDVHFLLTSAMLVFCGLTVVLILVAEKTCAAWAQHELCAEEPGNVVWDYIHAVKSIKKRSWFVCCGKKKRRDDNDVAAMDFLTYRMEFKPLLTAQPDTAEFPRMRNCDQSTAQFAHFNFAHYLSIRYGKTVSAILGVQLRTWALLGMFMLLLVLPLFGTWKVQVMVYVIFGYVVWLVQVIVSMKLDRIWQTLATQNPAQKHIRVEGMKMKEYSPENAARMLILLQRFGCKPPKALTPKEYKKKLTKPGSKSFFYSYSKPGHTLWWFGSKGDDIMRNTIQLIVMCSCIAFVLVAVAASRANAALGAGSLPAILISGYFPLLWIMVQMPGMLEQYTVLSSVGAFRKIRDVQRVVDESHRRMASRVACLLDWLILAFTRQQLETDGPLHPDDHHDEEAGTDDGHDEDPPELNVNLLRHFFEILNEGEEGVGKRAFVDWYRRTKLRSAKSRIPPASIGCLFDHFGSGTLSEEQFKQLVTTRDMIEQQVLYNICQGGDYDPHESSVLNGMAYHYMETLLEGAKPVTSKKLREKMADYLKHSIKEENLKELFHEARVVHHDHDTSGGKKAAQAVPLLNLVQLMLMYAPSSQTYSGHHVTRH